MVASVRKAAGRAGEMGRGRGRAQPGGVAADEDQVGAAPREFGEN
jgi:hypothetical protein